MSCCMGFNRRWPRVVALVLLKFLTSLPFGMQSLQFVSVCFIPPNLLDFAEQCLLWCLISTGSEFWFFATKSVWFCWATSTLVFDLHRQWVLILCHQICLTSALVSDLYRKWVLILCHQICLIFLSNIYFGVWSLQRVSVGFCATKSVWFFWMTWSLQAVSVDFVPPNLFDLAEQHLLWCLISTESECWFCTTKSVWSCWVTSALVSDLYRQWVLILLSNICSDAWSLQWVGVDFVPPNLSDLAEWIWFGVQSLQAVSIDFVLSNLFDFSEQHLLWCLILQVVSVIFAEWHPLWCLIFTDSEC